MTEKRLKLLVVTMIVLLTTLGHVLVVEPVEPDIGGDEPWYTHNAIYLLGSGLHWCRLE
jgi:hypothetical protein